MPPPRATPDFLEADGVRLPLVVRRNPSARRISLRVHAAERSVVLTVPEAVPLDRGLRFVEEKAVWILNRMARLPQPVAFAPGAQVPYLGEAHEIDHRPQARGGVWREPGRLVVTGTEEHVARRLADWFREEARRELGTRARRMAAVVDRRVIRVTVRDTRSRWGSCSAAGSLNFSWRLILAPGFVVDYVVAHEVAHLVEMNHSPRFWAVVDRLTDAATPAKAWLSRHGASLHRYGVASGLTAALDGEEASAASIG